MGAGDVKLLAMVGAFLGPLETLYAALWTLIAGGVLSVLFVLMQGTARRMFGNLSSFLSVGLVSAVGGTPHIRHIAARQSAGKMPYAIVIATGTMASLVSHQFGFL
jgi:prepilin peptidase CpaA